MLKTLACCMVCSMIASTVVLAHHSYADYNRDRKLSIEGTIDQLTLGNPHAILTVRTDEGTVFTAEWGSAVQLNRTGVVAGMLAVGDRVIVTGSPWREPSIHRLSLIIEIVRPRDGWRWSREAGVGVRPRQS